MDALAVSHLHQDRTTRHASVKRICGRWAFKTRPLSPAERCPVPKGTSGSSKKQKRSCDRHLFLGHNRESPQHKVQETRGNLGPLVILFWPRRFSDGTTRSRDFHTWCGLRTRHKRRARYASGVDARRTERCGTHALRERGGGCMCEFVCLRIRTIKLCDHSCATERRSHPTAEPSAGWVREKRDVR